MLKDDNNYSGHLLGGIMQILINKRIRTLYSYMNCVNDSVDTHRLVTGVLDYP